MGMGKSSGNQTTTVQMTPEQQETLRIQNDALKNTFLPAYQNTVAGAQNVYNQAATPVGAAAGNASTVASQTGRLQQNAGDLALQKGLLGQNTLANQLSGTGQAMSAAGQGTAGTIAQDQNVIGNKLQTFGGAGAGNTASYLNQIGQNFTNAGANSIADTTNYQQQIGQNFTNAGANALAGLFSPQYKQEQINASLQPAREDIREQLGGQNAMFGGAGGLGSSRMALANQNLSQLGQQRLQSAAAQTSANVETQRQNAENQILGTGQAATQNAGNLASTVLGLGQGATTGAGNLYSTLLGGGQGAIGQANTAAGNLMNYGQGASGLASGLYGNLANQGATNLTGANQAAASQIGYAGAPQDLYSKYAGIVFGTPQASTTPNYAGTQGGTSTGNSKGFGIAGK
jgi:hypothetical protein